MAERRRTVGTERLEKLRRLWNLAAELGASDIHVAEGTVWFRRDGVLAPVDRKTAGYSKEGIWKPDSDIGEKELLYLLAEKGTERHRRDLADSGQCDFSWQERGMGRLRVNLYRAGGTVRGALRLIPGEVPVLADLGLPPAVTEAVGMDKGLVLITGMTGSGKSSTLAAIIQEMNRTRPLHIITLEDPVEFSYPSGLALIQQRELGRDTADFSGALRAALREDPDVILVGEMRDRETIATALTAAETGHLVLGTLHTSDAVGTVSRIVSAFPPEQQQQVCGQLGENLRLIVSQKLLRKKEGKGRFALCEVLVAVPAICRLVRENRWEQIQSYLETGGAQGMQTFAAAERKAVSRGLL